LEITKVEAIPLRLPSVSDAIDGSQDDLVVRVHTDEGLVGIGEVDAPPSIVKAIIEAPTSHGWSRGLGEVLIGADPLDPRKVWDLMYQATIYHGRRGVVISAMSGVDIAVWDILGKAKGKPVHRLLGSKRSRLRPYASIYPFGDTPAEITKTARRWVRAGFRAAKFQCAPFGRDPRYDVRMVAAAREGLGGENDLMVDACMCWTDAARAIAVARSIEKFNVYWIEAPFPPDDVAMHAELADAVDVKIAGGDINLTTRFEFEDLMDRGHVDVVQPDVTHSGGITELMRIAEMAERRGKEFAGHAYKTGIGLAATLHVDLAAPGARYLEFSVNQSVLRRTLTKQSLEVDREGYVSAPDAPGLGVELNEDVVRKFRTA
jgi:L-alanine-DL-glutamate epimerase-like enolase superfamily enzyme